MKLILAYYYVRTEHKKKQYSEPDNLIVFSNTQESWQVQCFALCVIIVLSTLDPCGVYLPGTMQLVMLHYFRD